MSKTADLTGSATMPYSVPPQPAPGALPPVDKVTLKKTGAHLVPGHHGEDSTLASAAGVPGEQPQRLPQSKTMKPHVDVTGFDPPKLVQEKKAQITALNGRYPLDTAEHVKLAAAYFQEWLGEFAPSDRHVFAANLLKRADALGMEVSDDVRKHGSETYAPMSEIKIALDLRKLVVTEPRFSEALDKLAAVLPTIPPDLFAETLSEFDKTAGIAHLYDEAIYDPYYSTFGFEKVADFSETIGNLHVTAMDLKYLCSHRLSLVKGTFTEDFAEAFRKNPIDIYKSLPIDQRRVLGNMAVDQRAGAPGG